MNNQQIAYLSSQVHMKYEISVTVELIEYVENTSHFLLTCFFFFFSSNYLFCLSP